MTGGVGISLLQYADDTIIMVEGSDTDIASLKFLLLRFQQMSGLKINFDKSDVMVMAILRLRPLTSPTASIAAWVPSQRPTWEHPLVTLGLLWRTFVLQ